MARWPDYRVSDGARTDFGQWLVWRMPFVHVHCDRSVTIAFGPDDYPPRTGIVSLLRLSDGVRVYGRRNEIAAFHWRNGFLLRLMGRQVHLHKARRWGSDGVGRGPLRWVLSFSRRYGMNPVTLWLA